MAFYKGIPTKFNNLGVLINYLNLLSNKPREKVWCPKWIEKAKFHSEKGFCSHHFFSHINILQDQHPPRRHIQKCHAHRSGTPFSTPGEFSSPKEGSAWRLTSEPGAFLREEVCLWTLNTTSSSCQTWKWNSVGKTARKAYWPLRATSWPRGSSAFQNPTCLLPPLPKAAGTLHL